MDPEGGGGRGSGPPGKSQDAMGFIRKSVEDHNREAIGPLGSSCFLREPLYSTCK